MSKLPLLPLFLMSLALSSAVQAQRGDGHIPDCNTLQGLKKARCERHTRMYDKCHAIKGEAHHICDREFLIAHPLECDSLGGKDAEGCRAERDAIHACREETGSAFFRCARDRIRADPRKG
jgi:hypothetical protein